LQQDRCGAGVGDGVVDLVNQHIRLFMDRMFLFETHGGILSGGREGGNSTKHTYIRGGSLKSIPSNQSSDSWRIAKSFIFSIENPCWTLNYFRLRILEWSFIDICMLNANIFSILITIFYIKRKHPFGHFYGSRTMNTINNLLSS